MKLETLFAEGWDDVPTVSAVVVMSRRAGGGAYRLGLMVERLPGVVADYVNSVATPTSVLERLREDSFEMRSALSREVLYQTAWARLEARRYEEALSAAICALEGDPDNRHYRALAYRAAAETCLMTGHHGDALWHFIKAHAYAPRDPEIRSKLSCLRVPAPAVAWAA